MVLSALNWLIARPIAHRGLHDAASGVIENTAAAVSAAMTAGYGIEVDLHITADGEAMVHHDDVLGRLTEGEGRIDALSAAALKRVPFRGGSGDPMMTLGDLCDLVAGRAPLLLELRSRFDSDIRLPIRVAAIVAGYGGPVAAMSFDPMQLRVLRYKSPSLPRGFLAIQYRPHPYYDQMPTWLSYSMGSLLPALIAQPQFVAYGVAGLPAFAPLFARRVLGLPLLTWTVQTPSERQRAERWADQMIFEGFRP
ncbi:MAG TPA: glycerophosphodiester phosphodiesterase family protein [Xanthobacteraceae bacterium]|jgi:glycerophosphoryl diester phosphodiesterase|nr:glycerophosphodiester phosphodiesterase family protein [Xanthobacteraceae bacterium]